MTRTKSMWDWENIFKTIFNMHIAHIVEMSYVSYIVMPFCTIITKQPNPFTSFTWSHVSTFIFEYIFHFLKTFPTATCLWIHMHSMNPSHLFVHKLMNIRHWAHRTYTTIRYSVYTVQCIEMKFMVEIAVTEAVNV